MKTESAEAPTASAFTGESGRATFKKNYQEIATLDLTDTESGVEATIKTSNLGKGRYALSIVDACSTPARSKTELPKKKFKLDIGEFVVKSGFTVAEFSKPGLSIGDRHILIGEKSVRLSKKGKKGNLISVACSKINKL